MHRNSVATCLSRLSVSLKSLGNYFFRCFAYKSLLSRFSVLISYNMWSSNHFSISSCFPCFSSTRFFRVQVFDVRVQVPGSRSNVWVQVLEVAAKQLFTFLKKCRGSHQRCSIKKVIFKNFANFKEKHLCWSLFIIKLQAFSLQVF